MNECDWVAAENIEDAMTCMKNTYGDDFEEYIEDPCQLTDEEMDSFTLGDEDEYYRAVKGKDGEEREKAIEEYKASRPTFRQALAQIVAAGQSSPFFFASTEY